MNRYPDLKRWARAMRYFRFTHAHGGHANDADTVSVVLRFDDQADLGNLLRALSIEPIVHVVKPTQPVFGKSYSVDDYASFPSLVPHTEWMQQPCRQLIDGAPVFVWCDRQQCRIDMLTELDNGYSVAEVDITNALLLEPRIATLAERWIDPPHDTPRCICPKHHPGVWAE
jgi:hypothetical protein